MVESFINYCFSFKFQPVLGEDEYKTGNGSYMNGTAKLYTNGNSNGYIETNHQNGIGTSDDNSLRSRKIQ